MKLMESDGILRILWNRYGIVCVASTCFPYPPPLIFDQFFIRCLSRILLDLDTGSSVLSLGNSTSRGVHMDDVGQGIQLEGASWAIFSRRH